MIDATNDVEFKLPIRSRLKYASVDFDLLGAWSIESSEEREDSGFFASPGRAIYQEMRKVRR